MFQPRFSKLELAINLLISTLYVFGCLILIFEILNINGIKYLMSMALLILLILPLITYFFAKKYRRNITVSVNRIKKFVPFYFLFTFFSLISEFTSKTNGEAHLVEKTDNNQNIWIEQRAIWVIIIFGLISIFFFPWVFTRETDFFPSFLRTGPVGDTINGVAGPFIALLAAILTFQAFKMQFVANREQRLQFAKQAEDTLIERFENRYFEMIRLHRANVEEQNVQNLITGRKVFTTYYFELRYIFFTVSYFHEVENLEKKLSIEELTNLAYFIFFFGIGHVTNSIFNQVAPNYNDYEFFKQTIAQLKKDKETFSGSQTLKECCRREAGNDPSGKTNVDDADQKIDVNEIKVTFNGVDAVFKMVYEPFTGHGTKIGHYYRHLFQTVKYVDEQTNNLFTKKLKYSYIKILRAQLSNIELVMFYYNINSSLGRPWITKGFISKYRFLTNLPLPYVDFGLRPEDKFKEESSEDDKFFEWNLLNI